LAKRGILTPIIDLIENMYKNCKTEIKTKGGIGVDIGILRGVKQGDPLSPLLFNICMEPLLEAVEENTEGLKINERNKIPILAFADDIVLLRTDKKEAQKLSMVQEYLKSLGMNMSEEKCLTIHVFSKRDTW
jgi:hypothetical protein